MASAAMGWCGFDNLVEIVFLPTGEIIGTDNWFQWPSGGIRDALVHLTADGLYPRQKDKGTAQLVTGDFLPAIAQFPAVAFSGLEKFQGFTFPPAFRGNLFAAEHNSRKVRRHLLIRSNDTFAVESFEFVAGNDPDFHPSDVLEDPSGGLVVIDTGGWYVQHCPTGKIRDSKAPGGIYRVSSSTAGRITDPWGLKIAWPKLSLREAAKFLGDPRFPVRGKAQDFFSRKGSVGFKVLENTLFQSKQPMAQESAVWALANSGQEAAGAILIKFLNDAPSEMKPMAARALGYIHEKRAAPALIKFLKSSDASIRLAAAEALTTCGRSNDLASFFQALIHSTNRFEDHALIRAIYNHASAPDLERVLEDPDKKIQRTAMLLLDQPPHQRLVPEVVLRRIADTDPQLHRRALEILQKHPEWSDAALEILSQWIQEEKGGGEKEHALPAVFLAFQKNKKIQDLVGGTLLDPRSNIRIRILLLQTLGKAEAENFPVSWLAGIKSALTNSSLRPVALKTISVLNLKQFDADLISIARDETIDAVLRMEAFRAISPRLGMLEDPLFNFLFLQLQGKASLLMRLSAGEILGRLRLSEAQVDRLMALHLENKGLSSDWLLGALAGSMNEKTSVQVFKKLLSILERTPAGNTALELFFARVPSRVQAELSPLRSRAQSKPREQLERLQQFEPLLLGGDEEKGRKVFFNTVANCASCHQVGNEGGKLGPDLTRVGAIRSGRDLLESILFPSSTFAQGYESFSITDKDDEEFIGSVIEKTSEQILIRDVGGNEKRFSQGEIKEMRRLELSLMPEGIVTALKDEEFRDLLAFLQGLK